MLSASSRLLAVQFMYQATLSVILWSLIWLHVKNGLQTSIIVSIMNLIWRWHLQSMTKSIRSYSRAQREWRKILKCLYPELIESVYLIGPENTPKTNKPIVSLKLLDTRLQSSIQPQNCFHYPAISADKNRGNDYIIWKPRSQKISYELHTECDYAVLCYNVQNVKHGNRHYSCCPSVWNVFEPGLLYQPGGWLCECLVEFIWGGHVDVICSLSLLPQLSQGALFHCFHCF